MFNFRFIVNIAIYIVLLLYVVNCIWRTDRRPKYIGNQITRAILPHKKDVQEKIVRYHNYYRSHVSPTAANMLRMNWNKHCAKSAQKWSKQCMFLTHDNVTGRYFENYGACGQNIFVSSHKVPWLFAIKTWYLEKDNFTYASRKNYMENVGHYTQLVWAATHQVGCGFSKCNRNGNVTGKIYYNYVCNYCPIGNRPGQNGRPYKVGRSCDLCKKSCHSNKLCTNICNMADLWANCRDLFRRWPKWLCETSSDLGKVRQEHCRATCECKDKIHD